MSVDYHSFIRPDARVMLKLSTGILKPVQLQNNITISIPKFGSFSSNSLIGRPYHLTYEVLDKDDEKEAPPLRLVSAAELTADLLFAETNVQDENVIVENGVQYDANGETGEVVMRNNRHTVDDSARQTLTPQDIDELKKTESGKEIIAKIMAAHSGLDEKTAYSLAKYASRKSKKYIRRITVLPLDVNILTEYMLIRDSSKIMDLRLETLSLITNWANVHHSGTEGPNSIDTPRGRWLVVDDTGGLIVAAMAEKMGILYPRAAQSEAVASTDDMELETPEKTSGETAMENGSAESEDHSNAPQNDITDETSYSNTTHSQPTNIKELHQSATTNTITLLHPHTQPSIALLRYFSYSAEDPQPNHPLFYHLQALTWLQLLDPEADATYAEKPSVKAEELASWKPSRRGAYFRKFRRWQRIKNVVDNTRSGGFDGLVVASFMEPATILKHLVPLVKGGGQVVVYSPTIESLTELMDFYSRERRRAYQYHVYERMEAPRELDIDPDDFPVDPTLLLHPILQVVRAVEWQVLPSRTHPLMTSRGGPEGYLFTATRVLPAETHVSARGTYSKKRKTENPVLEQSNKRAKSIELAEAVSSSA